MTEVLSKTVSDCCEAHSEAWTAASALAFSFPTGQVVIQFKLSCWGVNLEPPPQHIRMELERTMYHRLRTTCLAIGATVLLGRAVYAETPREATVSFDPAVAASIQKAYGAKEAGVLRSAILTALANEERRATIPDGLTLKITVHQVLPTHPTMKQQLDNPSLSPVHTRYLGGADLVGEVRDSKQQVLATIGYRNFVDVLASGSPSLDPWADARLAIDSFAAKFAATWDKLPKS
jgi:hypothetical protein